MALTDIEFLNGQFSFEIPIGASPDTNIDGLTLSEIIHNLTVSVSGIQSITDQFNFSVSGQVDANALTGGLDSSGVRSAVGLSSANLDIQLSGINAKTTQLVFTSGQVDACVKSVTYNGFQDIFETYQYTESYAATGADPTPAQAALLSQQAFTEFALSGVNILVKQLDGTTNAATYEMDSSSTPTQRTRIT
jgi:hypothetical protein